MFVRGIKDCPLFAGIDESRLESLLGCLAGTTRTVEKDEVIFGAGDRAVFTGIVLSGGVRIIQEDFWGNRTILTHTGPGDLFGEAFSCSGTESLPVSAVAGQRSEIMLIDSRKIVSSCPSACAFHARLTQNMLRILADKNILLNRKIEVLSKRTIREKLLSFLSAQALEAGGGKEKRGNNAIKAKGETVQIPFNRQELADSLCVDRSALSRELSLMQKEGLLRYEKNCFTLNPESGSNARSPRT